MILIIDNYDSFVETLARYVRELGFSTRLTRNDALSAAEIAGMAAEAVMLSPGPHGPQEAGVCLELLALLPPSTPLLGVCLGHQCLVAAFGGEVRRALRPLHGEASEIRHDGNDLFSGVPSPFSAGRYHSLIAEPASDGPLRSIASSAEGETMAVAHINRPWHGVQFHPESLLTPHGRTIVANFLAPLAKRRAA